MTPAPRRVADPASRRVADSSARAGAMRRVLGLALLGLLLPWALAGCARTAGAAGNRPTRVPSGLATALSTASAEPSASTDPVDRLRGALLGPGDLGPGWLRGVPPVPDATTPAPCGGPGTVARFPDALRVGSTVDGPAGGVVQEALSVYGDPETARAAFRAAVAGLDCGKGTLHDAPVTIAAAQDRRADVGGDLASSWQVGSDTLDVVLVVVLARQAVFSFAYVTPVPPGGATAQPGGAAPGPSTVARPDPLALSRAAVARALAA